MQAPFNSRNAYYTLLSDQMRHLHAEKQAAWFLNGPESEARMEDRKLPSHLTDFQLHFSDWIFFLDIEKHIGEAKFEIKV